MVCPGPEWQEMAKGPWEVVPRMSVYCLEQTERNPKVDGQNVQVVAEEAVQEWTGDGALRENKDFEGVCVLCGLESGWTTVILTRPIGADHSW